MTPMVEPPSPSAVLPAGPGEGSLTQKQAQRPGLPGRSRLPALFIALFTFLLASFPAQNSDLWAHLAAGRDVAHGRAPIADAASGQSWLYDLVCYGVYSVTGGAGLVIGKALLVAGLGLALFRLSRAGTGWWVATGCTVLALLAMGMRLLLQPAMVSYLFLALTLLTLKGRDEPRPGKLVSFLPPWPLAVLFLIWANVDSWFVVGLGTVALIWLGQLLDEAPADGRVRALLRRAVSLAGLAAVCLLNPTHIHAFVTPAELGWSGTPLGAAAAGLGEVTTPFQRSYLTQFGRSPAGLAYFPLLGLGLLSFVLTVRGGWRWQRFLPWLGLAVLSAIQVRAVPFFAVVGGPVLAWNLQYLYGQWATGRDRSRASGFWSLAARVSAVTLGLAALLGAWTGWLQAPPFGPRRWAVETPPALERCAAAAARWHREGRLGPNTLTMHLSPDTAHAFAWFCPEDRGVLSARLTPAGGTREEWVERMRDAGVTHAVVSNPHRETLFDALEQFLADPDQWPLLFQEGDVAVFGWRDPAQTSTADPFRDWQIDLNRLAFHPDREKVLTGAPPEEEARTRHWWEAIWEPAPPRSIDHDEAAMRLLHANAVRKAPDQHVTAWEATHAAGLIGAASAWTGPGSLLDAQLRLTLLLPPGAGASGVAPFTGPALASYRQFVLLRDDTPPAVLFLAIRAARRALAVNPDDAQSHLVLGESYLRLIQSTRERASVRRMPELFQLRCAQASAALNRAVALRPSQAQAHRSLGQLYLELGYLDLAVKHLRTALDRLRDAGPPRGVTVEQFRQLLARSEEELAAVAQVEQDRQKAFADEATGSRVLDRALLAMRMGLAGKARDLLLASDVAAFGPQGMALELDLLTMTGRVREVRDWMAPEQEVSLGAGNYRWQRVLATAAAGDYRAADEEMGLLAGDAQRGDTLVPQVTLAIGQAVLDDRPTMRLSLATLPGRVLGRLEFSTRVQGLVRAMIQRADVTTLRGLLALETGEVDAAAAAFRLALTYWDPDTRTGADFNGRSIAHDYLTLLESAKHGP